MFGLEILDVVIGLTFVYLLLALFATALNEYIAAVLNLRGKELAKGLGHLLDDADEADALRHARNGVGARLTTTAESLTEQLYNHRLIHPFATRQGWMTRLWWWLRNHRWNPLRRWLGNIGEDPRLPSYIPARTFALALLDLLGVDGKDASLDRLIGAGSTPARAVADAETALAAAQAAHDAGASDTTEKALKEARQALARIKLAPVLAILKQESSLDLTEHLTTLGGLSTAGNRLAADLQLQVAGALADAPTQLQKLHDSVEVWFNNAMDRVSGAYKRTAQGWLFVLGLLIASCMNADTIDMWRRLEANDELRSAMVARAAATLPALDTLAHRTPQDSLSPDVARERYQTARARLDEMELKLGWSSANPWPTGFWPSVMKIIGLLLTALAISLGAPFWFDLLNKVISIRTAGRSPAEQPKSPEGSPKRIAERAPK